MGVGFILLTIVFSVISVVMILIILVQRPQGGGLAGAFGGAGGSSTETVFGGRVGDALTIATTISFLLWMGIAISLNLMSSPRQQAIGTTGAEVLEDAPPPGTGTGTGTGDGAPAPDPITDLGGFDPSRVIVDPDDSDIDFSIPADPPPNGLGDPGDPDPGDPDPDPDPADPDPDAEPNG